MIKIITSNDYNLVNNFLNNNFSSPTHYPDWNDVISKNFNTNFYYLLLYENKELTGICPVHEIKKNSFKHWFSGQFHYNPYGGWILSQNGLKSINNYKHYNHYDFFQIFALPQIPEFSIESLKKRPIFFKTLIVDLTKNLDKIWSEDIDTKRRNMIRKAEKNNIRTEILENKFSDNWYSLYLKTNKNYNLEVLSETFFVDLFKNTNNISFLIINAYYEDNIISSAVIVLDKFYSIYWLGNNLKQYNLGQSELIQWTAIKKAKEMGCKYYDLCYIEKDRLPHIYEFKKGFSKWEVDVPLITYKSLTYRIVNKLKNVFRLL